MARNSRVSESRWILILVVTCITLAVTCYTVDYLLFRDAQNIVQFLLEETGFVFVSVILVTLVLDKILTSREMVNRMQKLNMVIGAFFSEIGTELITLVADFDGNLPQLARHLILTSDWQPADFVKAKETVMQHKADVSVPEGDLKKLRDLLYNNQGFLLSLLQNPNLLENEAFTDLLWALFHTSEELNNRKDLDGLTNADKVHISGDLARAYKALLCEWLSYLSHLKTNYPYLFSFAIRTNPFDPGARVEFSDEG